MGIRGELFSTKVALQNRTYFFNVKENRLGDLYLNIVESKNRDEGGFERQSVILFADDLQEFLQGFDESLRVLEKEVREKRRGKTGGARKDFDDDFAASKAPSSERPRSARPSGGRDTARKGRRGGDNHFGAGKSERPYRPAARPGHRDGERNFSRGESSPRRGSASYTKKSRSFDNKSFESRADRKKGPPPGKRKIVVKKR